jgi:MFS family permease
MSYLRFIADNPRLLTVGFLLAFSSSFGQTYFIALFGGRIRADLGLSHGEFGGIYALATLASAMTLIWAGRKIDHIALELYVLAICGGLVVACLLTGWSPSVIVLGLGLFGLRLFGQGLMHHAGTTSMARYFDRNRGKAIAVASIGHPAGEAVFPLLAVLVMGLLGWRGTWVATAAFLGLVLAPLVLWLLMHPGDRTARALAAGPPDKHAAWAMQKTLLRQPRFFAYLFCTVAQPFIFTGVGFYNVHIVAPKLCVINK